MTVLFRTLACRYSPCAAFLSRRMQPHFYRRDGISARAYREVMVSRRDCHSWLSRRTDSRRRTANAAMVSKR